MTEKRWDETFVLEIPEGFSEPDEEQKKTMRFPWGEADVILQDPVRHMIISLGSKKAGGLVSFLAGNVKEVVKTTESKTAKAMNPFGYSFEGDLERTVAETDAYGYRYSYTARDTAMSGETYMMKTGSTFRYLHVYYRTVLKEESIPVWNAFLDSIRKA